MSNKRTGFVIMPFSSTTTRSETEWTEIYESVFTPAFQDAGYSCERSQPTTGSLIKSIIEKLKHSTVVLADLTDQNANVFYELGVRHSLSRRTILVSSDVKFIPSDLRGYWSLLYATNPRGVERFKKDMQNILKEIATHPNKSDNPVADYLEREHATILEYLVRENLKKLSALFTECSGNLLALERLAFHSGIALHVCDDCLKLLLQTRYIDLGPAMLKQCYELEHHLVSIRAGNVKNAQIAQEALPLMKHLCTIVLETMNKLASDELAEPSMVSIMEWQPRVDDPHETCFACLEHNIALCGAKTWRAADQYMEQSLNLPLDGHTRKNKKKRR